MKFNFLMTCYKGLKYGLVLLWAVFLVASCSSKATNFEIAKEYPTPDENKTAQRLIYSLKRNIVSEYQGTQVLRAAHPKHHGCVRAKFIVPKLPPELRVGLFSQPGQYIAWIRFSTATGTVDHDKKEAMLGMAVKVIGVEGKKLLEDEQDEKTQDFLMISHPVLPIRNAKDFLDVVNEGLWFFLNPFDSHLHELGIVLKTRHNHPTPLEIRYWSTTPYLFGHGNAVKYSARPCLEPTQSFPETLTKNYLRQAMTNQLAIGDVCFDFMVQFQTDPNAMPIEDATVLWNESISPFKKVAKIIIPKQVFDSDRQMEFCENLSMTPWHSLPEHRPLGSINRVRKDVYRVLSQFRHEQNKVPIQEPIENEGRPLLPATVLSARKRQTKAYRTDRE